MWTFTTRTPDHTATACSTDELYDLLVAVLPIFHKIAARVKQSLPTENDAKRRFYLNFIVKTHILHDVLQNYDASAIVREGTQDESDVRIILENTLNRLEGLFRSLSKRGRASEFENLGMQIQHEAGPYKKLTALKERFDWTNVPDEALLDGVSRLIRIHSSDPEMEKGLLSQLEEAYGKIDGLISSTELDPPCPHKFRDYPLEHVRGLSKQLFKAITDHWIDKRPPNCRLHDSSSVRLNLTQHQRFEIAPFGEEPMSKSKAHFRVLFPSLPSVREWQRTEITVDMQDCQDNERQEVIQGLCVVIQRVKPGDSLSLLVIKKRLWEYRVEDGSGQSLLPQVYDKDFSSLKDVLRTDQRHNTAPSSLPKPRDRLVLSFVLTTFLLHGLNEPWLRKNLKSENICFYVSGKSSPDITQPFLEVDCCGVPGRLSLSAPFNQRHRFPDVLALGILLLEVAQWLPIETRGSKYPGLLALEHMKEWENSCQKKPDHNVHRGVRKAIAACLVPEKLRSDGLAKSNVNEDDVRRYIFKRVLYPLGDALSAYKIQLRTLLPEAKVTGYFDHRDEEQEEKKLDVKEWRERLEDVHELFFDCEKKYKSHVLDKKEARVRVAVLDTGFQPSAQLQSSLQDDGRIDCYQSKDFSTATERIRGWQEDCDGHGSRIGQLILDVAPGAILHVAKVFDGKDELKSPEKASEVHDRIAKAITQATHEWKVHIIVMCFGFNQPIRDIEMAIEDALHSKNPPIFFAATGNHAAHERMAWPANDRSVIGISSTTGSGARSSFNPLDSEPDGQSDSILYALGEGLPDDLVSYHWQPQSSTKFVSGTSYATAVAAGLAANLLGCARMLLKTYKGNAQLVSQKLHSTNGMLKVLKCRMHRRHTDGRSLLPWDFLNLDKQDRILSDIEDTLVGRCCCDFHL